MRNFQAAAEKSPPKNSPKKHTHKGEKHASAGRRSNRS
jgi:hypothetical protein